MTTIGSSASGSSGPDQTRGTLVAFAALTSVAAFLVAVLGLVVVATKDVRSASAAGAATSGPISVTLSEFKIAPAAITAPSGEVTIKVTNSGSVVHNLSIPSIGKKTKDLTAGQSETLNLGSLKDGTYALLCEIPGHEGSGMKATLTVGGSGSGDSAAGAADHNTHGGADTDWAAMEKKMTAGMSKNLDIFLKGDATKGAGNQKLAPTQVEADGTKVFDLEAGIIDWEVSPGKTVKAWAYNNQVPGPWIRTEPNDKIKVRLKNKLPVSTDIHWHGISTPFKMDGVAPVTQEYVAADGGEFTYSWTNPNHSELGMYHAHDHGQVAVLNGMFAILQVGDVPLPKAGTIGGRLFAGVGTPTYEMPMVLNDAGVIGLSINGKAYPATAPIAMQPGESMLVHYYNEGLLAHPMHLHKVPQLVVAKDGFPLDSPYWVDTLNVAPGERYSVLIMPTANDVGVWAYHCHILNHAENDEGLFGMVTALVVGDPLKKS